MATTGAIEIPVTIGGVKEVRQQIKQLRGELINATDPKEVERLSANIGELSDKLKDANEKANVFASGSKFEQAGNAFSLMKSQIADLDFQAAGESAALFASRIKAINPAEFGVQIKGLISVVGNLSKAFFQMGVSLLANPIFLIAAAIVGIVAVIALLLNKLGLLKPILDGIGKVFKAIGDAIDWVIGKIKEFLDWLGLTNYAEQEAAEKSAKAAETRADAWKKYADKRTDLIDQTIRLDQLEGKNTVDLEIRKQALLRQTAHERIKALNARIVALSKAGELDAEELKKLKESIAEQRKVVHESTQEIQFIRAKDNADKEKAEKAASDAAVKNAQDEAKRRSDAYKKYRDDRRSIEREIQDLVIAGMVEGEDKERAQVNAKYQRAIEDVVRNEKYLASERTKIIALLEAERTAALEKVIDDQDIVLLGKKQISNNTLAAENVRHQSNVLAIEEKGLSERLKIELKYAQLEMAAFNERNAEKISAVQSTFKAVGDIATAFAGKNEKAQRKAFKIQKVANIASATIDTYKGAASAFASAGNPILGAVFAAAVIAAGLANIMKIKNTEFGGGGTPSASTSASMPSTASAAPSPAFMFQGGANQGNNLSSANSLSSMTVQAVVSESEITSTQKKVNKYQSNAIL